MEETRSELWAGIVMIVAVIIVVSMVMTVGKYADIYLKPRKQVVVYLDKVHGIKVNDPVHYAGMEVGQVTGVEFDQEKEKVKLTMGILVDKVLRKDTTASIALSMMGIATVEISPGNGTPIEETEGEIEIKGEETSTLQDVADKAGAFLENLKTTFGEEQRKQIQETIAYIKDASSRAKELFTEVHAVVEENSEAIGSIVKHLDETAANLRQITSENKEDINTTIQNIRKASDQFGARFKQVETVLKGVNDTVAEAKKFMGSANLLLDENRKTVDDTLRNVKDVTANLQIMSEDLRRHPWKLLNKPTEKEIVSSDIAACADQLSLLTRDLEGHLERLLQVLQQRPDDPALTALISSLKETIEAMRQNQAAVKEKLSEPARKK